jgi:hypothetical protein
MSLFQILAGATAGYMLALKVEYRHLERRLYQSVQNTLSGGAIIKRLKQLGPMDPTFVVGMHPRYGGGWGGGLLPGLIPGPIRMVMINSRQNFGTQVETYAHELFHQLRFKEELRAMPLWRRPIHYLFSLKNAFEQELTAKFVGAHARREVAAQGKGCLRHAFNSAKTCLETGKWGDQVRTLYYHRHQMLGAPLDHLDGSARYATRLINRMSPWYRLDKKINLVWIPLKVRWENANNPVKPLKLDPLTRVAAHHLTSKAVVYGGLSVGAWNSVKRAVRSGSVRV